MFNSNLTFSNNTTYTAEGWVNNTRANNAVAITGYVLSRGGPGAFDALGIMGNFPHPGRLFVFNNAAVLEGPSGMTVND